MLPRRTRTVPASASSVQLSGPDTDDAQPLWQPPSANGPCRSATVRHGQRDLLGGAPASAHRRVSPCRCRPRERRRTAEPGGASHQDASMLRLECRGRGFAPSLGTRQSRECDRAGETREPPPRRTQSQAGPVARARSDRNAASRTERRRPMIGSGSRRRHRPTAIRVERSPRGRRARQRHPTGPDRSTGRPDGRGCRANRGRVGLQTRSCWRISHANHVSAPADNAVVGPSAQTSPRGVRIHRRVWFAASMPASL